MNIVLVVSLSNEILLPEFVESCVRDKINLIAVCGAGAEKIENEIDWLIISDGTNKNRFIITTSHEDEKLSEVLEFSAIFGAQTKVVRL